MLGRRASDVPSNGMLRVMTTSRTFEEGEPQLRLLLVGGNEKDLADRKSVV